MAEHYVEVNKSFSSGYGNLYNTLKSLPNNITNIVLSTKRCSTPYSLSFRAAYENRPNLKSLDASNFNASKCESFSGAFFSSATPRHNLTTIVPPKITNNCLNINNMFYGCSYILNINNNGWDISNVKNLDYAFAMCHNLQHSPIANLHCNTTRLVSTFSRL